MAFPGDQEREGRLGSSHPALEAVMKDDGNPLRAASECARAGKLDEAIDCLESALARTRSDNRRPANTSLLAKTAGLFCEQRGSLLSAASYYDEAISTGDLEPLTHVALAHVHFRLGRANEAQACLARAESLAQSTRDSDAMRAVATTRARWAGGGA